MTDDTISRKMAIDVIDKIFPADPMRNDYTKGITCGAALATEYIKQLPSAELPDTNVGDIISRQTVLNECLELAEARRNWETEEGQAEIRGIDAVMCALHDLPSAQPQRKSACLIAPNPYGKCSNCGQLIDIRDEYNYCPNCGAHIKNGD